MEALFQKAAKLPRVELLKPENIIGKNTIKSLQAGAVYGYVGAVGNIVNEMKQELGGSATVIATGGLAKLIGSQADLFSHIDRSLTLDGLRIIYEDYKS